LVKYSVTKDPEIHKAVVPPVIDPDGRLNVDSLRKDWQFFKDTGQIDGKVTVDGLLDTSFVEAAVASLGRYRPATRWSWGPCGLALGVGGAIWVRFENRDWKPCTRRGNAYEERVSDSPDGHWNAGGRRCQRTADVRSSRCRPGPGRQGPVWNVSAAVRQDRRER